MTTMSKQMISKNNFISSMNSIECGKKILELEINALSELWENLGTDFKQAVDAIFNCSGRVIVTGVGKAGIIGQKISATLASTATPSYWMHAVEARHGDLGRVLREDIVLALSNSGETEVVQLIAPLKKLHTKIISITGHADSTLAQYSDIVLNIGRIREACPLGLAPSCTTTAMLALGDALALTIFEMREMTKEDYAFFHPGGDLGRRLIKVKEVMRTGSMNPVTNQNASLREAVKMMSSDGSPGALSLINENGKLSGFFTDGDLRRIFVESIDLNDLGNPIENYMTKNPLSISQDSLAAEAYRILREKRIDNLPVINEQNEPVGILDVQDWLDVEKGV